MKKIVILSAGKPHVGTEPPSLKKIGDTSVLEWQLNCFDSIDGTVDIVLGFQSSKIKTFWSKRVNVVENVDWATMSSAGSLLLSDLNRIDELWIAYGDMLFHKHSIDEMSKLTGDLVIGYDSDWRTRYHGRSHVDINKAEKVIVDATTVLRLGPNIQADWASGEFVGLARFSGDALETLRRLKSRGVDSVSDLPLSEVIDYIRAQSVPVIGFDFLGKCTELNEPSDLAQFVMGTKAETLARLRNLVKNSIIQDQLSFTVDDWLKNSDLVVQKIGKKFTNKELVVRSSALNEDAFDGSNAGAFLSLLNVHCKPMIIRDAVDRVIASYRERNLLDQVLVQPMLLDEVIMCGVAFTRSLEDGSPYYVINFDETGSTDGITSGTSENSSLVYVHKGSVPANIKDENLRKLIFALKEIEEVLNYDALDIEFAIDNSANIHVLQVRPLVLPEGNVLNKDKLVSLTLRDVKEKYRKLCQNFDPYILGTRQIYGNMPDWNPAEIIGTSPTKFAFSLYEYMILDSIWALQRFQYGYRDVRGVKLMTSFAGKPYIDVRASVNSFIPRGISDDLATSLIDFYLEYLSSHPHLQDKVEFEVVPTCLSVNWEKWSSYLQIQGDFTEADIDILKKELLNITNGAFKRIHYDMNKIETLQQFYENFDYSHPSLVNARILLEKTKTLGTLPFAHLARAGFIAISFLKEAVTKGILSEAAQNEFLSSIRTVSHDLTADAYSVRQDRKKWRDFVKKYGHLRPGTYDITSDTYGSDPDRFLKPLVDVASPPTKINDSSRWDSEKSILFETLNQIGVSYSHTEIELFMRLAIENREKAKFVFSRGLSIAMDIIADWGTRNDISRRELSNLSVHQIFEYIDQEKISADTKKIIDLMMYTNKKLYNDHMLCKLPPIIDTIGDFTYFKLGYGHANFVGEKKIIGDVVVLKGDELASDIANKIVIIPQADPGYDWLFGQNIAGLITMYGGANSHMAIRSAEYGLPAAIGVGEKRYGQLCNSRKIELSPGEALIRIIY